MPAACCVPLELGIYREKVTGARSDRHEPRKLLDSLAAGHVDGA
jgi:hypothetical protein